MNGFIYIYAVDHISILIQKKKNHWWNENAWNRLYDFFMGQKHINKIVLPSRLKKQNKKADPRITCFQLSFLCFHHAQTNWIVIRSNTPSSPSPRAHKSNENAVTPAWLPGPRWHSVFHYLLVSPGGTQPQHLHSCFYGAHFDASFTHETCVDFNTRYVIGNQWHLAWMRPFGFALRLIIIMWPIYFQTLQWSYTFKLLLVRINYE